MIRPAEDRDAEAIWAIVHAVAATGDTYAIDPETTREDALGMWMGPTVRTFVAEDDAGKVVGTYILKANQAGGGSHVANAAFMVDPACRGQGWGRAMGEHAIATATDAGFRAMQFNFVVSTNAGAVRLWESLGFEIVGTLPGAFAHPAHGHVDAYVMYRWL